MSERPTVEPYSLFLYITGRKTEKGVISRSATLDHRLCDQKGIDPGDILTVKVVEHVKAKEES